MSNRVTITVEDAKTVTRAALGLTPKELDELPQSTLMAALSLSRSVLHLIAVDGRTPEELTEPEQAHANGWLKLAGAVGARLVAQPKDHGFDYFFEQLPVVEVIVPSGPFPADPVIEPVLPVGPDPEPANKRSRK